MDPLIKCLLAFSNVIVIIIFSTYLIQTKKSSVSVPLPPGLAPPTKESAGDTELHNNFDAEEIVTALSSLESAVLTVSHDLRNINKTSIQFAYLSREADRMEELIGKLSERIRSIAENTSGAPRPEMSRTLDHLKTIKKNLGNAIDERNKAITVMVRKLEIDFETENDVKLEENYVIPEAGMQKFPEESSLQIIPDTKNQRE